MFIDSSTFDLFKNKDPLIHLFLVDKSFPMIENESLSEEALF